MFTCRRLRGDKHLLLAQLVQLKAVFKRLRGISRAMGKVPNHKAKKGNNKKGALPFKRARLERFNNRHIDQVHAHFLMPLCGDESSVDAPFCCRRANGIT